MINNEFRHMQKLAGINEMKVNKPQETYYLNPIFKRWLNQDYDDIKYKFGEDTADAIYCFKVISRDNKKFRKSDVQKWLDEGYWTGDIDSFINFLFEYDVITNKPTINEMKVNKPDSFNTFLKSYKKYLDSISRAEMFDEAGNYNNTLKQFHKTLKQYAEQGTKEQKTQANFVLQLI